MSNNSKIGPFVFKTDGSGGEHLMVKKTKHSNNLYMNGPEVLKFSLSLVPLATKELLKKASLAQKELLVLLKKSLKVKRIRVKLP